jgi:hypothetical protein
MIPKSNPKKAGDVFNTSKSGSHNSSTNIRQKATTEYQKSRNNSSYITDAKPKEYQSVGFMPNKSKSNKATFNYNEISEICKAKRKPPNYSLSIHHSKMNVKKNSSKKKGIGGKSLAGSVKPRKLDQQILDIESGRLIHNTNKLLTNYLIHFKMASKKLTLSS